MFLFILNVAIAAFSQAFILTLGTGAEFLLIEP